MFDQTTPSLHRWKHWFQEDPSQVFEDTLVVLVSINPYDWIDAMQRVPHNMPMHMMNDWKTFLTTPWTMERPERDLIFQNTTGNVCQHDFKYNQVISCIPGTPPKGRYLRKRELLRSQYQPIYELNVDGSGEAYKNILQFRTAKKKNLMAVKEWEPVKAFVTVQYEELVNNGPETMIKEIEEKTGMKASCDISVVAPIIGGNPLDESMISWISKHLDWTIEQNFGYTKGIRPYTILSNTISSLNEDSVDTVKPSSRRSKKPSSVPKKHKHPKGKKKIP